MSAILNGSGDAAVEGGRERGRSRGERGRENEMWVLTGDGSRGRHPLPPAKASGGVGPGGRSPNEILKRELEGGGGGEEEAGGGSGAGAADV